MPPMAAAADDFLILEYVAGNRRIPHGVFDSLLACLSPPSAALPRASQSQLLRKALVLRALDAALHTEDGAACSSSVLLDKAREALADPDAAACFPHQISFAENGENDEARAAAAVADLKRLLDLEWANLPPSTLKLAADRVAGDGDQTCAAADHTKRARRRLDVGESTEREILAKLVQDGSASHPIIPQKVADNKSNETDGAPRDDEAHSSNEKNEADHGQEGMADDEAHTSNEKNEADHGQEGMAEQQGSSVTGAEGVQFSKKPVPASKKRSLLERNPNASTSEWDSSDDDQPVRKHKLHPSPKCAYKIRKRWSEIEEKTLLEGVEKYGKGYWKDIKLAYPDVFEERSTVDLKDKFRNLEKRHRETA